MRTKETWVHVTFNPHGVIRILFVRSLWLNKMRVKENKYEIILNRKKRRKLTNLIQALALCRYDKQVIVNDCGWSMVFRRLM